jgi:biotin synthase-related radical SAM superfamily protein
MTGECWEVTSYGREPDPISIVSETEKSIIVRKVWREIVSQSRRMKNGMNLFATWPEAKAYIVSRAEMSLEYAKEQVAQRQAELEAARALMQKEEKA